MDTKYLDNSDIENLSLLRVHIPAKSAEYKKLSHRDYLGSVLGLGLERKVIGDIIVCEDGADISVSRPIAEFLELNLKQIGRVNVSCEILPIEELRTAEIKTQRKNDTVASLRLDNIVSSAFNLSRAKAQDAIRRGEVNVNQNECTRTDYEVKLNDKVSLRHFGKVMLSEIGGESRKGRICITIEKFI